jgi:hypothetical protein
MSETPDVRWTGRTNPILVEVAEAVATTTDLIMATYAQGRTRVALYTLDGNDPDLMVAYLERDDDGILRVLKTVKQPGAMERMRAEIEERLR